MSSRTQQKHISDFWRKHLGYSTEDLAAGQVTAVTHGGDFVDYHGAFCFLRDNKCLVSVPAELTEHTREKLFGKTPLEMFDPKRLEEIFEDRIDKLIGPAYYGYADVTSLKPWSTSGTRRLRKEESDLAAAFLESLEPRDREISGLTTDTPVLFGFFDGNTLTALAGYEIWAKQLAHLGIVSHPTVRGKGHSKRVLSAVCKQATQDRLILQYRTLHENAPALALAKLMGFQHYGSSIAARFKVSVSFQA